MAIDHTFLDALRARTSLVQLIGKRHKLVRSSQHWKTCCPFHGEKTPSFYVYDDHYHCFSCQEHGDAISWLIKAEGHGFRDAVEILASMAGLEIPQESPEAARRAAQKKEKARALGSVTERVQAQWRLNLHQPEGAQARTYLHKRGIDARTEERFGLGWSGNGRSLLARLNHAAPGSVPLKPEQLAEAGLLRPDAQGRPGRELFFNRLTFPIHDVRGRLVSFGGRVLGDGQPKYLNGPETPLFAKRRTLFNIHRAREAVRGGQPLIVAEGYMDVIAFDQGGFEGAVAPLGTAVTEEQIALLWRTAPTFIVCFDGDKAGQKAQLRVAELALAKLQVGHGVRFCTLSGGDDPDSLLRSHGPAALAALIDSAQPLAEATFSLLLGTLRDEGPDERGRLRRALTDLAATIPDKALGGEYRSTFLDLFFKRFRSQRASAPAQHAFQRRPGPWPKRGERLGTPPLQGLDLAGCALRKNPSPSGGKGRLALLLVLAIRRPTLLHHVATDLSRLPMDDDLTPLQAGLLDWWVVYAANIAQGRASLTDNKDCVSALEEEGLGAVLKKAEEWAGQSAHLSRALVEQEKEGRTSEDGMIAITPLQTWLHLYALVNAQNFEREVEAELNALDLSTLAEFPPALQARLDILGRLRDGGLGEEVNLAL
ncbi:DNA primase [Formicincola oecophyllae]|uniref:DNA primase n=1 Tax=Formicincola oecophyllae TaxID=2558361 RepID=A0A4Y6U7Z0_9PROT|nr:DNA primase [Formicincola oecophyllae]QDH13110.1 DNA primase [Formicincola oecophyllae]